MYPEECGIGREGWRNVDFRGALPSLGGPGSQRGEKSLLINDLAFQNYFPTPGDGPELQRSRSDTARNSAREECIRKLVSYMEHSTPPWGF